MMKRVLTVVLVMANGNLCRRPDPQVLPHVEIRERGCGVIVVHKADVVDGSGEPSCDAETIS
jgi:hypothetical protein